MLNLDTLHWSTIVPHPTGFSPPSVHGHTTVEDPNFPGRLIVFGGRGGTHWNTEVRRFSLYVCIDTQEKTQQKSRTCLASGPEKLSLMTPANAEHTAVSYALPLR